MKYIGDGIYLKNSDNPAYKWVLFTSNGVEEKNHVYLGADEAAYLSKLLKYNVDEIKG